MKIPHITLNSGHTRMTTPEDISKEIYFTMKLLVKDMKKPNGAVVYDGGYYAKIVIDDETMSVFTLYAKDNLPLLTTAVVKVEGTDIWEQLSSTASVPAMKKVKEPKAPYIVDRLELGIAMHMRASKWTGDFSKTVAWVLINPDELKPTVK